MSSPAQTASRRYVAFISYSHVDRDVARWLHRALEAYRVPPHLRTSIELPNPKSGRLSPVFLDREELPSSTDLAESVRIALDASDALIVVCSPTAAGSRWVTRRSAVQERVAMRRSFVWSSMASRARGRDARPSGNACLRHCCSRSRTASSGPPLRSRWRPTCVRAGMGVATQSSRSSPVCSAGLDACGARPGARRVSSPRSARVSPTGCVVSQACAVCVHRAQRSGARARARRANADRHPADFMISLFRSGSQRGAGNGGRAHWTSIVARTTVAARGPGAKPNCRRRWAGRGLGSTSRSNC